jgi:uncharacterized protein (TIGR02270 family)
MGGRIEQQGVFRPELGVVVELEHRARAERIMRSEAPMPAPGTESGDTEIAWDVVEEHLDEVEFLIEQWSSPALRATLSLDQLQRRIEPRLLANIDGLAAGGQAVAERLLWPAFQAGSGGDPGRRLAAAVALVETSDLRVVLAAAISADGGPERARAMDRALELTARTDVDQPLVAAVKAASPARARGLLEVLAARRLDPGPAVGIRLAARDPKLVTAALHASAAAKDARVRPVLERLLGERDREVRRAAMLAALTSGLRVGWSACLEEVRSGEPPPLDLLALFGAPADHGTIIEALAVPKQRHLALWALGLTGRAGAVAAALPLLRDPDVRTARLAAEVVSSIAGLAVEGELRRPAPPEPDELPELEKDLRSRLDLDAVDGLPLAEPDAVEAWWAANRQRFDPERRYLRGQLYTAEAVGEALRHAPLRRFDLLAFELAVRSAGQLLIPRPRLGLAPPAQIGDLDFQGPPRLS